MGTPGDHQAEGQDTESQRPTGGEKDDRPALLGSFQEIRIGMGHQKREPRDFPFRPVGKTPHSQSRGPVFNPWSEN